MVNTRIVKIFAFLVALTLFTSSTGVAFGQSDKDEKMTGGKIDKVNVIYAVDGYMVDSEGALKYFIFGAVKLHKKGAPKTEWAGPILYFEFDDKRNLAGNWDVELYSDVPRVKRYYALADDYKYSMYNRNEYAAVGLSEGPTPHEFEFDFIFNKDGTLDIEKSSMGIVPKEYQTGRKIKSLEPTGEYYKKGSKTEKAVVITDARGKIINMDELGDPVEVEGNATVDKVCYDYYSQFLPTPTSTPWKEREKLPPYRWNESPPEKEAPPAPDITPSLYPDPKETPVEPSIQGIDRNTPYKPTGICSIYKIQNISRSAGLPDAEALGLIRRVEMEP